MKTAAATLSQKHFVTCLTTALVLHVLAFTAWSMLPKEAPVEIPVQVLNLKLGDSGAPTPPAYMMPEFDPPPPPAPAATGTPGVAAPGVKPTFKTEPIKRSRAETSPFYSKAASPAPKAPEIAPVLEADLAAPPPPVRRVVAKEARPKPAPVPANAQYVRQQPFDYRPLSGNTVIASAALNYAPVLSAWIQKFKVYPAEAQAAGIEGEALVRIRIDRQGNIRTASLQKSAGNPVLDKAVMDMLERANPVPPVPADYPQGADMEFNIPVSFRLR